MPQISPTVWLAIGEGLSSVLPNAIALVQFAGLPSSAPPRLSEGSFFACMAAIHLISLGAAIWLMLLAPANGNQASTEGGQAPAELPVAVVSRHGGEDGGEDGTDPSERLLGDVGSCRDSDSELARGLASRAAADLAVADPS